MNTTPPIETFISVDRAAVRLGVPAAWLRAEARAGRVPCLRAGKRLLVNVAMVRRALAERAERDAKKGARDDK